VVVHANVGRDFRRRGPDYIRAGTALEWAPLPAWSFVAERFREADMNYWRAGARYVLSSNLNVDLGQARGLGASAPAWWTLGLAWSLDR
jgi:hypothetical protein